jgi:NTE family protein
MRPRSLLDNSPLRDLLQDMVPLHRLPGLIEAGHVQALAVTASSYSSGQHVTFFQGHGDLQPWTRSQRIAARDAISHEHLLASAAIPFVFPAMPLNLQGRTEFFGDGSMRQSAPIAPAIHLGAERIVVVGAGRMHEPPSDAPDPAEGTPARQPDAYPSLAQIAGHALSNIFLDALSVDVERVQRINQTIRLIPEAARQHSTLRPVELLVIAPSQRLDAAAARHIESMPSAVLTMLAALGVRRSNSADFKGAALASYLLFEQAYTRELMGLGYGDTWTRRDEVLDFFGWKLQHEPLGNPERQDAWAATQM